MGGAHTHFPPTAVHRVSNKERGAMEGGECVEMAGGEESVAADGGHLGEEVAAAKKLKTAQPMQTE